MQLSRSVAAAGDSVTVHVRVKNESKRAGDEVIQVYASAKAIPQYRPLKTLVGFQRVHLLPGQSREIAVRFAVAALREYDSRTADYTVYKGDYELSVGGSSADPAQQSALRVQ